MIAFQKKKKKQYFFLNCQDFSPKLKVVKQYNIVITGDSCVLTPVD